MNNYIIEFTDLFGGDLNYSFVQRYIVQSVSLKGAVNKFSRFMGMKFKVYVNFNLDSAIYHSVSGATGYTIDYIDVDDLKEYKDHYQVEEI